MLFLFLDFRRCHWTLQSLLRTYCFLLCNDILWASVSFLCVYWFHLLTWLFWNFVLMLLRLSLFLYRFLLYDTFKFTFGFDISFEHELIVDFVAANWSLCWPLFFLLFGCDVLIIWTLFLRLICLKNHVFLHVYGCERSHLLLTNVFYFGLFIFNFKWLASFTYVVDWRNLIIKRRILWWHEYLTILLDISFLFLRFTFQNFIQHVMLLLRAWSSALLMRSHTSRSYLLL